MKWIYVLVVSLLFLLLTEKFNGTLTIISRYIFYDFNRQAEGEIEASEKLKQRMRWGRVSEYYIKYTYEVNGVRFESNYVKHDLITEKVDETLLKYPIGKKVHVFYSDKNPSISMLEMGSPSLNVFLQIFYIFMLVAVVFFIPSGRLSRLKR